MAYDTIVIGAGHNGLTTAALLAKAGRSVLVVEAHDEVGGIAASHEFHPGYRTAGLLSDSCMVRPHVVAELGLLQHGLKLRDVAPSFVALGREGQTLKIAGRPDEAAKEIGRLDAKDGERYPEYVAAMGRLAGVLRDFFDRPPIDVVDIESESLWNLAKRGLSVRRMGKNDMLELLRLPPMCVADVVGEWFRGELIKAALSLPALAGTFTGPWSPGNAINLLRREALAGPGIVGGGPMLVAALRKAAEAAGAKIRTGARVREILMDSDGVRGVLLQGGEKLEAKNVASSCDPKTTLLELVPVGGTEFRVERNMRNLRTRGSVAHVSFAIEGEITLGGHTTEFARTGGHVDDLERAFDAIKYKQVSPTPVLDIHVPTVTTPSLAPKGGHVVSALVYFAPTVHAEGWDDATRKVLADRVQAVLAEHAPALSDRIVGREVLAPPDLAARYGACDGDLFHGEHSLDQILIRPTPECIRYRTPITGLYLCGSGSHPGGGLTCGPGDLAAKTILAG